MTTSAHVLILLPPLSGPIRVSISRTDGDGEQPYFSSAVFPVGDHATTGDKDYLTGMIRALKFADRNTATADKRTLEIK